eukprot:COSAG05_NODE_474_length_9484_cov_8.277784_9_plen_73_part_00
MCYVHAIQVALEYFRRIYKSRATYEESDILASMPPAMRMDFSTHLYQKFLAGVPIFRYASSCLVGTPLSDLH